VAVVAATGPSYVNGSPPSISQDGAGPPVDDPPPVVPVDADVAPALVPPFDPSEGAASHATTRSSADRTIAWAIGGADDRRSDLGIAPV
jgi:hypothetical protein